MTKLEKNHAGGTSTSSSSPGGNWRIWPFSLSRSGSRESLPPIPNDAKIFTDVNKIDIKPNLMKKKVVRVTTPTSEQIASLNLKEGRNIVTFTFSTTMLGKQQVCNHEFCNLRTWSLLSLLFIFLYFASFKQSYFLCFKFDLINRLMLKYICGNGVIA